MRWTVPAVVCLLDASVTAVAQSFTPAQQEAIQDLAYVVAAIEECNFTAGAAGRLPRQNEAKIVATPSPAISTKGGHRHLGSRLRWTCSASISVTG